MKRLIEPILEQMKYADTYHIELISICISLFYIPEILTDCVVQEPLGKYWFMCSAIFGVIGLIKQSINWRYLHVQCMLISYLIPLFTIVIRNAYHPLHLKFFAFQAVLSIYLIWRIGSEKIYRKVQKESCNG
jgi:hypothetical protein